jgi:hypothetical protein
MNPILILSLLAGLTVADVPTDPPQFSDLELDVICDVAAPTIVTVTMSIALDFDGRISGIAIERGRPGSCAPPVRFDPIEFGTLLAGRHVLQWRDDTAESGLAYRYRAVGIDSQGQDTAFWPSFSMVAPVDYATCGDPVIGHGFLTSAHAPGAFEPCPGSCWDPLTVEAGTALVQPYVDSQIAVDIRGTIDCRLGNVEGCTVTVSELSERACLALPVRPTTWGVLKSRF